MHHTLMELSNSCRGAPPTPRVLQRQAAVHATPQKSAAMINGYAKLQSPQSPNAKVNGYPHRVQTFFDRTTGPPDRVQTFLDRCSSSRTTTDTSRTGRSGNVINLEHGRIDGHHTDFNHFERGRIDGPMENHQILTNVRSVLKI